MYATLYMIGYTSGSVLYSISQTVQSILSIPGKIVRIRNFCESKKKREKKEERNEHPCRKSKTKYNQYKSLVICTHNNELFNIEDTVSLCTNGKIA